MGGGGSWIEDGENVGVAKDGERAGKDVIGRRKGDGRSVTVCERRVV